MKRMQYLWLFLITPFLSTALNAQMHFKTVYDQLVYVNKEWVNQQDADPLLKIKTARPLTEQQLVQQHLTEVEKLLRKRATPQLAPSLRAERLQHLDVLHQYLSNGIFPINLYHEGRQPYFIDAYNTFCAVGYLMKQSGAEAVARDIQRRQNYNFLTDIHHEKLMRWVMNSGLRFDELALIQPSYGTDWPATIVEMHYNNNGPDVHEYIEIHQNNTILMGSINFNQVRFYDAVGTLYKTLALAQMQSFLGGNFYAYEFPSGESFEDLGRVELWGRNFSGVDQLISKFVYSATSVDVTTYPTPGPPITKSYPAGESESTTVNYSLNFCGGYYNPTYNLVSMPVSLGTLNSCIVLPVTLTTFNHTESDKQIHLFWETSSESGTTEYVVERSSNGVDFTPIGTIPAAGTGTAVRKYNYTDISPLYINHYRLKVKDLDGKFAYSKILYVKVNGTGALQVEHTLVKNLLRYQVTANAVNARMEMYDMSGRILYTTNVSPGAYQLDISDLPSGKYILRLLTKEGQHYHQQFIKQ
ncbi:MAG: T9SS type A sorting domain-containing protein [Bacteroidetes bacterium]|nr:T9SS type A sorting domain-containing protein [Bacteroidota bacterium]